MTAEEWEFIKTLFEQALEKPEASRDAYLAEACGERTHVLRTVRELLANHVVSKTEVQGTNGAASQVLRTGELVAGRLRVVRYVAAGGMGEVYEVYDEVLETRLALKVLRAALLDEPGAIERFQREVLTAREVSHRNVCRVYDLVEHRRSGGGAPLPCLTMELLEGESLAELLARTRPLPVEAALRWISEIAEALEVLHGEGLVHRDLKPSNVMLARRKQGEPTAVVMDFGLAKSIDEVGNIFETRMGWTAGSPYFMAPELLRHGRATRASDIYAFGLLIDEMVTAKKAFEARSLAELYYAKLWEKPIGPRERAAWLPEGWVRAIESCLDGDPGKRPGSAGAVVAMLEAPAEEAGQGGAPRRFSRREAMRVGWMALGTAVAGTTMYFVLAELQTSIDVFDIDDQTGRPDLEYVAKGTVNEVLRRFTQLRSVRVAPVRMGRVSSPGMKTEGQFQLSGALTPQGAGAMLRMELTDREKGEILWARTYGEAELKTPVKVQEQIAGSVAKALEDRLLYRKKGEPARGVVASVAGPIRSLLGWQLGAGLAKSATADNQALDAYMRGSTLLEEVSGISTRAAIEHFERALQLDASFALAQAALAQGYLALRSYEHTQEEAHLQKAQESAERSVRMDPELAEGFAALAAVRQARWDWEGAEAAYLEALRLKPSFARVHRWYAGLVIQFARFEEGLKSARRAMELDPYDRAAPTSYGLYLFYAGHYQEAIDVYERSIAGRDAPSTRYNLGLAYARTGMISRGAAAQRAYEEALRQAEALAGIANRETRMSGRPASYSSEILYALVYVLTGRAEANTYLAVLEAAVAQGKLRRIILGHFRCMQGRFDEAMDCFEQVFRAREPGLMYFRVDPFLERLRGTARFEALLRQLKLQ